MLASLTCRLVPSLLLRLTVSRGPTPLLSGAASASAAAPRAMATDAAAAGAPAPLITIEAVPPGVCGQGPDGAWQGDSGVRLLRLNNTEGALNSLTPAMAAAFEGALERLAGDTAMRALVLTGEGRAFSAGGDYGFINDRIKGDVADNERVLAKFYTTFLALRRLPVPTIAAINGPAVGGGCGLAMACDMRIASTAARLSFNFVKLGLTPGMASAALVPAATSHAVACRLLLTGDLVDAGEAERLGLVLQVVEPDRLLPEAFALAGRIAAASPSAVSATLRLLRDRLPYDQLAAAAEKEAALQAVKFVEPDCAEGVASVKGKRLGRFPPRA